MPSPRLESMTSYAHQAHIAHIAYSGPITSKDQLRSSFDSGPTFLDLPLP